MPAKPETAVPGDVRCRDPELAAALGVVDALVFRRVKANTWAHLGGFGRGRGWAGVVKVDATLDPLAATMPTQSGGVTEFCHPTPERVLGPYYARAGALVRVSDDVLVVLGNPTEPLNPAATDAGLHHLAVALDALVQEVSPAKHLADELEMLHAVRAVTSRVAPDLAGTLSHVVDVAVQSLSCEVGLARTGDGHLAATSSWAPIAADDPALVSAAQALLERAADGATCVQDSDSDTLPHPLGREQGVRSLLALALPPPVGGVLVVAHTSANPRGFTGLCLDLGRQLTDAAGIVLHTASLREELRGAAVVGEAPEHDRVGAGAAGSASALLPVVGPLARLSLPTSRNVLPQPRRQAHRTGRDPTGALSRRSTQGCRGPPSISLRWVRRDNTRHPNRPKPLSSSPARTRRGRAVRLHRQPVPLTGGRAPGPGPAERIRAVRGERGVDAQPGTAMDDEAAAALQGRRLAISSFRTQRLDAALLTGPALVLVASRRHRTAVAEHNPRAVGRTFTLAEIARCAAALDAPVLEPVGSAAGSPRERLAAVVNAAAALHGTLTPERSGDDDMADPYRQGADAMRATVAEVDAWLRSITALLVG